MNEDAICVWGIRPSASSLEDCTCSKSEPHDFKGCTHFSEMQVHLSPLQSLIVIFRLAFVRYSVCVRAHSLYHAALTLVPEASPVLSLTQHTHWDSRHLVTIQQINKDTSIMLEATCMGMCVCVCVWIKNLNCHVISLEERTKSSRPSHVSPRPSRSLLCIQTLTQNSCLLSQLSLQALSLFFMDNK